MNDVLYNEEFNKFVNNLISKKMANEISMAIIYFLTHRVILDLPYVSWGDQCL